MTERDKEAPEIAARSLHGSPSCDDRRELAARQLAAARTRSVRGRGGRAAPLVARGCRREILEAYDRAVRGGRRPAVVSLVASVCSGCHVRLHSTLEQKIRRRRGVAPCPHCLRLVYDPAWLDAAAPRG